MSGQANRNSSSNSYDSLLENSLPLDASVIITGYEKPWLDRSAICLDAGSDTDHEKIENNETAVQDQDNETRRSSFTSLKNDSVIENSMTIDKSIIITQYEKPWADRSAIDLEPDCYSEQCVVKTTESNTTPSDVQQAKRDREKRHTREHKHSDNENGSGRKSKKRSRSNTPLHRKRRKPRRYRSRSSKTKHRSRSKTHVHRTRRQTHRYRSRSSETKQRSRSKTHVHRIRRQTHRYRSSNETQHRSRSNETQHRSRSNETT